MGERKNIGTCLKTRWYRHFFGRWSIVIPFLYINSALIASIKSVQSGARCPAYGVWCKGNSCQNSIWKALYALLFKRNGITCRPAGVSAFLHTFKISIALGSLSRVLFACLILFSHLIAIHSLDPSGASRGWCAVRTLQYILLNALRLYKVELRVLMHVHHRDNAFAAGRYSGNTSG